MTDTVKSDSRHLTDAEAKEIGRKVAAVLQIARMKELERALRLARDLIRRDRDSVFQCHCDPKTRRVEDADGRAALEEYDSVLARIKDTLGETWEPMPPITEPMRVVDADGKTIGWAMPEGSTKAKKRGKK